MQNLPDPYRQQDAEYASYYAAHEMSTMLQRFIESTKARKNSHPDCQRYLYIYYLRKIKQFTYAKIAEVAEINAVFARRIYQRVDYCLNGLDSDAHRAKRKDIYSCEACHCVFRYPRDIPKYCPNCEGVHLHAVTPNEFTSFMMLSEKK